MDQHFETFSDETCKSSSTFHYLSYTENTLDTASSDIEKGCVHSDKKYTTNRLL